MQDPRPDGWLPVGATRVAGPGERRRRGRPSGVGPGRGAGGQHQQRGEEASHHLSSRVSALASAGSRPAAASAGVSGTTWSGGTPIRSMTSRSGPRWRRVGKLRIGVVPEQVGLRRAGDHPGRAGPDQGAEAQVLDGRAEVFARRRAAPVGQHDQRQADQLDGVVGEPRFAAVVGGAHVGGGLAVRPRAHQPGRLDRAAAAVPAQVQHDSLEGPAGTQSRDRPEGPVRGVGGETANSYISDIAVDQP